MTSPIKREVAYTLPAGNVQIAFSGGRTSAYMLKRIIDSNGGIPNRAVVSFQNTGRERPETLDFVRDVAANYNAPVTWLEYRPLPQHGAVLYGEAGEVYASIFGSDRLAYMREWVARHATEDRFDVVNHNSASRASEPFEALIFARKFLPNQQMRFCSTELKVRTAKRYLMSIGWTHWVNAAGIRADEPHRLKPKVIKDRWTTWFPVALAGEGRQHVTAHWAGETFDLRLPNVKGNCWLGNCDGCFLKSEASVAAFTREFPEDALWWEGMERFASYLTNSGSAAFWSKRYSRASMREFMDRQGDWALSTEGILCQKSDGECVI